MNKKKVINDYTDKDGNGVGSAFLSNISGKK